MQIIVDEDQLRTWVPIILSIICITSILYNILRSYVVNKQEPAVSKPGKTWLILGPPPLTEETAGLTERLWRRQEKKIINSNTSRIKQPLKHRRFFFYWCSL